MDKTEVEKLLEARAAEIFTPENLGAITYFLNKLIDYAEPRIQSSEYLTIVHNAMIAGQEELIKKLTSKINPQ